ncbi:MAG: glucosaminidase domain-containing protein [Erysipelotrichaceae bacterium]|nr:glucosaminidase domain-containing protein [Erysipelotrichaceae bacterium]
MKKSVSIIIAVLIIITLLPLGDAFKVHADSYYPMGCPAAQFEVSYINDDGTFSTISCHDSLSSAKSEMKTNKDYVVRYSKSYSPSKIVAMNSGLAYTYPGRRNSSTMYLIQNPSDRNSTLYKNTYIANHYEMTYIKTCGASTYDIAPAGKGYIRVNMNGFEGFTDLEYTDLVPDKFLDNDIPIWLGGNNTYENEDPFLVKTHRSYYMFEQNGSYTDLVFHYYRAYPKSGINGNDALSYSIHVDNAKHYLDAGMKKDKKYYSDDGIHFYSDTAMTKLVATCYNYYQFLPLRSKTDISASAFDKYLKSIKGDSSVMNGQGSAFIDAQNTYGCNALIVYAMACLESAYGTSGYAINRNNLFGWSAYDDSPNNATYFSSVQVCVNEQMGRNLNWFMDYTNRRYFGTCVGNKGSGINVQYASDPYWGMKIASIAYSIDKYAGGNNGKLKDYDKYTIGFVKNNYNDILYDSNIAWDPPIYKSKNKNDILYTGRFGSHYQKDLTVIVYNEEFDVNRYKIASTNAVTNGSINTDDGLVPYNFNKSIGYIDVDNVALLYGRTFEAPTVEDPQDDTPHDPITVIDGIQIQDKKLTISGIGLITNYDFTENVSNLHTLNIYDLSSDKKIKSISCTNTDSSWYDLNDGHSYKYAGFTVTYDLSDLEEGSYIFKLVTKYQNDTKETVLRSSSFDLSFRYENTDRFDYVLRVNDIYGYRLELDVYDDDLDHSNISKPSLRSSLATIDLIAYEGDKMKIEGVGMIYYLNYNSSNISHNLYYVKENETIKADTVTHACEFDFQSFYQSQYDMENICYSSEVSLNDLDGTYKILLEIINGDHRDLLELTNLYNDSFPQLNTSQLNTSFLVDKVRARMLLKVEHSSGGN